MYQYSMTQWVSGKESCESVVERLKRCGYDGIELSAEPYGDIEKTKDVLEKYEFPCTSLCGMYPPQRDLSSANKEIRRNALQYVKDSIDMAVFMECKTLIVVPSAVGKIKPDKSYEEAWEASRESLGEAGEYAGKRGVFLAVEAINRFETFLVNRLADARKLVDEIGHPNVKMMADLFHMNIEERNLEQAFKETEGHLVHIHLADNTREPVGMGQIDFEKVYRILNKIEYQGFMTMEFMPRAADPYAVSRKKTEEAVMDEYTKKALLYCRRIERQCRE